MEDAREEKGRSGPLASCVHLYFTALSISSSAAAAWWREIKRAMESGAGLLRVTVAW